MSVLAFLLALGVTARVVQFVTRDILAQPIRDRVDGGRTDRLRSVLIQCGWCLSIWVALPVMAITEQVTADDPSWLVVFATTLTASYVVGVAQQITDRED